VAARLATGIGFLAGGVILRDGLNVRGLNTAATVWCVAGIGILAGLGRLQFAAGVTVLTVFANSLLHLLEHRVDRLHHISEIERPRSRR
jgi:putative Mg2+ transporter-C (MgtC) family protein